MIKRSLLTTLLTSLFSFSAQAESFSLPIWKDKAEALGYELPKAVGISLSYMTLEQDINVNSIALSGLNLPDRIGLDMKANGGMQKTDVMSIRADAWLFPFLNVYAIAGMLEGYSRASVEYNVTLDIPFLGPIKHKGDIPNFELALDGYMYGIGTVIAGGYGNAFALVDLSYTQTRLTVIEGEIDAIVVSPRIGYDFTKHGVPLRLWAGAMYQDVEQVLEGKVKDIDIGIPDGLVPDDASFRVEQSLVTKWNPLLGMQYQVTDSWYLLGEVGLGDRKSAFLSIDHRF
ncbi:hypothetical protein [Vibrio scophthalmi]|uniref:TonB-dependent receptor n=1 Tax=Vibrio scophthalmi LMG 19158 TaxID=870967 RepID=F9RJX9_9VIBR|nr:hypothetical protein [Vibrio scophthalmi]EGU40311.1 hypothetical protein VIS19158_00930 [Vibrio scophthalmi LMG 19158]